MLQKLCIVHFKFLNRLERKQLFLRQRGTRKDGRVDIIHAEPQTVQSIGGVLDVAAAAGTDLGRTSDIVSNVLTKTFTSSNTTLESPGETMKYVAPVAKSAGASIELMAAMVGVLGDAGIQGSMAGTTLRNTFLCAAPPCVG